MIMDTCVLNGCITEAQVIDQTLREMLTNISMVNIIALIVLVVCIIIANKRGWIEQIKICAGTCITVMLLSDIWIVIVLKIFW